jgi:hypothetical protein
MRSEKISGENEKIHSLLKDIKNPPVGRRRMGNR